MKIQGANLDSVVKLYAGTAGGWLSVTALALVGASSSCSSRAVPGPASGGS